MDHHSYLVKSPCTIVLVRSKKGCKSASIPPRDRREPTFLRSTNHSPLYVSVSRHLCPCINGSKYGNLAVQHPIFWYPTFDHFSPDNCQIICYRVAVFLSPNVSASLWITFQTISISFSNDIRQTRSVCHSKGEHLENPPCISSTIRNKVFDPMLPYTC